MDVREILLDVSEVAGGPARPHPFPMDVRTPPRWMLGLLEQQSGWCADAGTEPEGTCQRCEAPRGRAVPLVRHSQMSTQILHATAQTGEWSCAAPRTLRTREPLGPHLCISISDVAWPTGGGRLCASRQAREDVLLKIDPADSLYIFRLHNLSFRKNKQERKQKHQGAPIRGQNKTHPCVTINETQARAPPHEQKHNEHRFLFIADAVARPPHPRRWNSWEGSGSEYARDVIETQHLSSAGAERQDRQQNKKSCFSTLRVPSSFSEGYAPVVRRYQINDWIHDWNGHFTTGGLCRLISHRGVVKSKS